MAAKGVLWQAAREVLPLADEATVEAGLKMTGKVSMAAASGKQGAEHQRTERLGV
jgi:hypothetical protein